MKYIHLMAALCVASTLHGEEQKTINTDAQTIALSIQSRIREHVDPHYLAVCKQTKNSLKHGSDKAKLRMRETQKQLQEECNEMKQKVYQDYLAAQAAKQGTESDSLARLKEVKALVKKHSPTLNDLLEITHEYVSALLKQAAIADDSSAITLLEEEQEWLRNLEKTSLKAGISFDEPLAKPAKKGQKRGRTKKS